MSAPLYTVAETDEAGRPLRYLRPENHQSNTNWTEDPAEAMPLDNENAERQAGDWQDFAAMKGTGRRFRAVPVETDAAAYIIANEASDGAKAAQAAALALKANERLAQIRDGAAFIAEALQIIADTQAELARLSGLTPNTITALKQGKRPTAAQRAAISWAILKRWA